MSKKIPAEKAIELMVAAGLQPLEPYKNANANWLCICLTCNKEVVSRYNRVQQGSSCPLCGAKKGGLKIRLDEETAIARLAEFNLEPMEPYVKSDLNWKCKCMLCGQIVFPKLKNLQRGDGGCFKCGMKKAGLKNRLDEEEAILIAKQMGFIPLEPYINALSKWKMRHSICQAIVYPKLNSLSSASGKTVGCAVCSGHQVEVGINDLLSTHPQIASEADGWDPTTMTAGSSSLKKKWKCLNGHTWKTSVAQRTDGHGCPSCSISGFDPNKPGWLYLLKHEDWDLFQIGISNVIENRLQTHKNAGWEVLDVRGPIPGDVTHAWEQSILRTLRLNGASFASAAITGKFSGYTEAWTRSSLPVRALRDLMDMVHRDEE